jgi:methylaspartate ammonia-lyase
MRIVDLISVPATTGFYADDQAAIRAGAQRDGFTYRGDPITAGMSAIRMPGRAVSVMLMLDDGFIAVGDCTSVQYAGVGGRDPALEIGSCLSDIEEVVVPALVGRQLSTFRAMAPAVDGLQINGRPLHTAIRYGVTQALLSAVAHQRGLTMAEVVRNEYQTGVMLRPVPLFAQCGEERYSNVDKMVLREVDVLPHGLINNLTGYMGLRGELFEAYVRWVRNRVLELRRRQDYWPVLHFDTYGTVGMVFGGDPVAMAGYLSHLGSIAAPFRLRIEAPMDAGSREAQIEAMAALRVALRERGSGVEIVADEWCNTLEDVRLFVDAGAADVIQVKTPDLGGVNNTIDALRCVRSRGMAAYSGGSCNETHRSAEVCANIAMACGADQVLAKPGMGVDEGVMIVGNEMARVAALARSRARRTRDLDRGMSHRRRSSDLTPVPASDLGKRSLIRAGKPDLSAALRATPNPSDSGDRLSDPRSIATYCRLCAAPLAVGHRCDPPGSSRDTYSQKGQPMALAYILGAGIADSLHTGQDMYEKHDGVRSLYADVAKWTGFSVDQLLTEPLPQRPHQLRWALGEIRHAVLLMAIHDVLAESGIRPAGIGGLSLGALVGSCLAGSLSRQEFFQMRARTQYIPEFAPDAPEEGLAMWMAPMDADLESSLAGRADVYPAVYYGRTKEGSNQLTVVSGYRSALDSLGADLPPDQMQPIGDRPFAAHSPLRAPVRDFVAPDIAAATFHDPQIRLFSCLEPRVLTTGSDVRDLYLRNTVEPVNFPHLYSEMQRQGVELALALGQFMPAGFLDVPFPMVNVQDLEDIEEAKATIAELGIDSDHSAVRSA